jgi:hypothetical protein
MLLALKFPLSNKSLYKTTKYLQSLSWATFSGKPHNKKGQHWPKLGDFGIPVLSKKKLYHFVGLKMHFVGLKISFCLTKLHFVGRNCILLD